MRKTPLIIHILLLAILPAFLFSCSIQIRDSVKSSERMRGVYHRVKPGETLWRISKAYNVDLQELAEINNITDASRITAGSVVFIPDAPQVIDLPPVKPPAETKPAAVKQPAKPVASKAEPEARGTGTESSGSVIGAAPVAGRSKVKEESIADRTPTTKKDRVPSTVKPPEKTDVGRTQVAVKPQAAPPPVKTPDASLKDKAVVASPPKKPEPAPRAEEPQGQIKVEKGKFLWPVKGPVITQFGIQPSGMKYNGIKIAAKEGATVHAAGAGTIIYASYVKGYGDTIIVKHDENFTSVYAYLKGIVAKKDDHVKKGETIAAVGPAEQSGGEPYLYFEIREKNRARNPLFFLP